MRILKLTGMVGSLYFAMTMAGCATTDQNVNLLYNPVVVSAQRGTGELFLTAGERQAHKGSAEVQYILGSVKNNDGEKTGNIVTPLSPEDLLLDVFKQELTEAGYTVVTVPSLPKGAAKGLDIAHIAIKLDEVTSLVKAEATGKVNIVVDVWKKGSKVKRLEYGIKLSDFAVKDRELLLQDILRQGLENVMQQAVPELAKLLEQ